MPHPLDLPSAPARPITGEPELHIDALRKVSPRRARILLVNTDHFALHRLETYLTTQGYEVLAATTFEVATKLLKAMSPDLLVTNVRLGAFNGLHLAARSQFLSPACRTIILHTTPDPIAALQAERLGATFIVNPLASNEFLQQVRAVLVHERRTVPPVA